MPVAAQDFETLIHSLKIGVCRVAFGRTFPILFANEFFAAMLDHTPASLTGKKFGGLFADRIRFSDLVRQIRRRETFEKCEVVLKKKKGTVWASLTISVSMDESGKPAFLDIVGEDITHLKEVEQDLSRSKELFKIIFDNSAAAITVTDKNERIIAWNRFAEQMLGMDKKDLFNKPVRELYPLEEWRRMRSLKIRQKGVLSGISTQIIRKDNDIIDVDASISVIRDSKGNIAGSIGIMRDITKQKKIQEMLLQAKLSAEEANSAKSMFLAKMSHELRTPMNAIIGMIDLTLDTNLTEEQRENIKVAKDAATNLLRLINDILDLSRAESGKMTIESMEISIAEIVRSVTKGLTILAQNKSLYLNSNVASNIPVLVMGDPVRIRQIIINLVNNAIKFTHTGGVTVGVDLASQTDGQCELVFSIKDTGIGIPKDRQGRIFEVFSQADEKTSRRYGGTGLGLAISKKLSEMMGGRLWVESVEGQGSCFKAQIPFVISKNQPKLAAAPDQQTQAIPDDGVGRLKILLAEDNLVNQKIAVRLLEKRGWEVVAANNGREAIELLGKSKFDLILMDDHMPEMSGVEATSIIRTEEKQTGLHMPIIAMTANAMAGDREKYLAVGMDAYVSKPIDREVLFKEIINVVKQRTEG